MYGRLSLQLYIVQLCFGGQVTDLLIFVDVVVLMLTCNSSSSELQRGFVWFDDIRDKVVFHSFGLALVLSCTDGQCYRSCPAWCSHNPGEPCKFVTYTFTHQMYKWPNAYFKCLIQSYVQNSNEESPRENNSLHKQKNWAHPDSSINNAKVLISSSELVLENSLLCKFTIPHQSDFAVFADNHNHIFIYSCSA